MQNTNCYIISIGEIKDDPQSVIDFEKTGFFLLVTSKHIRMCEFVFCILQNIQNHINEIITS